MKALLPICLSLILCSCGLPDQPDGWSCSFFYDNANPLQSMFVCNRIRDVAIAKDFSMNDPLFKNAHCEDLATFKAYSDYVFQIKRELIDCRNSKE